LKIYYKNKQELDLIKSTKAVYDLYNNWNIGAPITECVKRNKKDLRLIIRDKNHKKCNGKILYFAFYNMNAFMKQSGVNEIIIRKRFFKNLENELTKEVILNTLISVFEHEQKRIVYIEEGL